MLIFKAIVRAGRGKKKKKKRKKREGHRERKQLSTSEFLTQTIQLKQKH